MTQILDELQEARRLIGLLTEEWIYASETGGDLHCYFCNKFQVDLEDNRHSGDCPYILAKEFLARNLGETK